MITTAGIDKEEQDIQQIVAYVKQTVEAKKIIVPGSLECLPNAWSKNSQTVFLDLKQYDKVLSYTKEDQVISVQTGIDLVALDQIVAANNQWLPLGISSNTTLLDVLSTGYGGALEYAYGGPRKLVLGLTVVLSDGSIIRTGGQVVKNVTGYDLTKLVIGSYGVFGIPIRANLRLYAKPKKSTSLLIWHQDPITLLDYVDSIEKLNLPVVALEIMDKNLLPKLLLSQWKEINTYLMIVRIMGWEEVVSQSIEAVLKICAGSKTTNLTDPEQEIKLWAYLEDLNYGKSFFKVEVGAAKKTVSGWWEKENWSKSKFSYCPGAGRFKFFIDSMQKQQELMESLKVYARQNPLTITYADEQYIWRVERLGVDMKIEQELFASLKKQFDPENCLNPFVLLSEGQTGQK